MTILAIDPGWAGGAWRFRMPDLVGQVAIAVVGACLAAYAAFEPTMIVWAEFDDDAAVIHEGGCGLYAVMRTLTNAAAVFASVMPGIIWSCWRRGPTVWRALFASAATGIAVLVLIGLASLPSGGMLRDGAIHAPGVVAGSLSVAVAVYAWHRLWMWLAHRYGNPPLSETPRY